MTVWQQTCSYLLARDEMLGDPLPYPSISLSCLYSYWYKLAAAPYLRSEVESRPKLSGMHAAIFTAENGERMDRCKCRQERSHLHAVAVQCKCRHCGKARCIHACLYEYSLRIWSCSAVGETRSNAFNPIGTCTRMDGWLDGAYSYSRGCMEQSRAEQSKSRLPLSPRLASPRTAQQIGLMDRMDRPGTLLLLLPPTSLQQVLRH